MCVCVSSESKILLSLGNDITNVTGCNHGRIQYFLIGQVGLKSFQKFHLFSRSQVVDRQCQDGSHRNIVCLIKSVSSSLDLVHDM